MADQEIPQSRPIVTRSEAKALGLKRYFTGKPCPRGHIAERLTSITCCLACDAENAVRNREKRNYRQKINYQKRITIRRAKNRMYQKKRRQKRNQYAKDRYREDRAYAERKRRCSIDWRLKNKEKDRISRRISKSRRRSQIKGAGGAFTKFDIDRIFKQQNGKCAYWRTCQNSLKRGFHVDHIIALSNGGTNSSANIQLCCARCNIRKRDHDPIEFAQENGMLV